MKPHAVVIPYPAQGHIAPVLKLAKLLHHKGFFITFVNTEFNHDRLVRARGVDAVEGIEDFQFRTIPDGLPPPSNSDATQDIPALSESITKNCLGPFLELIQNLNDSSECPKVSCIVSDGVMSFTLDAAEKLGIPEVVFFTTSACGFMGYLYYGELVARGYVPFKDTDESFFTNGYLDTEIDWIPGMKGIRLRDIPSFIRTTDSNDIMLNYNIVQHKNASRAKAIILNTYDELEVEVLEAIRAKFNLVYTIGPIQLLEKEIYEQQLKSIGSNLWKEDMDCLDWLDKRENDSVLYINFGSITPLSADQMVEFAWGVANSNQYFLWIIRHDMMSSKGTILPEGFLEKTKGRGIIVEWCSQEQVLAHKAIGGFLTHCGWNSTIETISEGVPMICWPFFAEQQTNCRYACAKWDIGVEIEGDVTREKVEKLVRVMMEGEKGKEMRKKALDWKNKAQLAAKPNSSSYNNLEKLITDTLLKN